MFVDYPTIMSRITVLTTENYRFQISQRQQINSTLSIKFIKLLFGLP